MAAKSESAAKQLSNLNARNASSVRVRAAGNNTSARRARLLRPVSMPMLDAKASGLGLYGSEVTRNGVAFAATTNPLCGATVWGTAENGKYVVHRSAETS